MSAPAKAPSKRSQPVTRSQRAKLNFPVGRVQNMFADLNSNNRISADAPVILTSYLEYVSSLVIQQAINHCQKDGNRQRITNYDIYQGILADKRLKKAFAGRFIIPFGGVDRSVNKPKFHLATNNKRKRNAATKAKKAAK